MEQAMPKAKNIERRVKCQNRIRGKLGSDKETINRRAAYGLAGTNNIVNAFFNRSQSLRAPPILDKVIEARFGILAGFFPSAAMRSARVKIGARSKNASIVSGMGHLQTITGFVFFKLLLHNLASE